MWRYDAKRSAASPQQLADQLQLHWVREYPALEPAWEDPVNQDRMPFDRVYEPVVFGSTMFFGSNRNDALTALDTRTGDEKWRFYADGPIRLPPVVWQGRIYFTSDDGYLYCVDATKGELIWKFRGGPDDRKIIGNSRMISAWPARGGPVIQDGVAYFAASIWPLMGTFIHAVDSDTGKVIWTNDATSATYINHPHGGSTSFGGVAPQGALVAVGDRLLVPGGRSVPACFDRSTGKPLYYHLSGSKYHKLKGSVDRKREGGSHVSAIDRYYLNHRGLNTSLYDLQSGDLIKMWRETVYPVLTEDVLYLSGNPVVAYDLTDLKETGLLKRQWELDELWRCEVDGSAGLIKAGERLYAGGENVVSAIALSEDGTAEVVWQAEIEGTAARLLAADDRLFVITLDGRFYAFGADEGVAERAGFVPPRDETDGSTPGEVNQLATEVLRAASVNRGYCLAFGVKTPELLEALARASDFRIVAVDADKEKVAQLRRRFDAAGLYGTRISVHVGDPTTFQAPPYVAAITLVEELEAAGSREKKSSLETIFRWMRPYGGVAFLCEEAGRPGDSLERLARNCSLPGLGVKHRGQYVVMRREGPLPGSADWTHQNGNVANTSKSDDTLVKLPLGILWFGGSSHEDVLPRHGHGPPEQVIGGRLFIEGINSFSARDVYTGQVLWKRTFDELGTFGVFYDKTYVADPLNTTYNQVHIAGANARGANYVACQDKVYFVIGSECHVLDPATGSTVTVFSLPGKSPSGKDSAWGYVGVYEDLLIAGSEMIRFSELFGPGSGVWEDFDSSSSRALVVMDRHSGRVLWTRDSQLAFRHNAIAAGNGRLFCIDRLPDPVARLANRRGEVPNGEPELLCLDIRTGEPVWNNKEDVFGTWLGYSETHDILIQCGRASRDMLRGEPTERMIAYRGQDGSVIWDRPVVHGGPCMIHNDTIFLNAVSTVGSAVSLLTGMPKTRKHPLTGLEVPWTYHRRYGCNSVVASEYLLTFRSGAAGYYDLLSESGTGNLGGFKSGCTANLIAAGGVLNAPEYTRTCTCSYQNQTSLALVHMPDVEMWTFNEIRDEGAGKDRILSLGINFGAPGDRRSESGTLWLDYPSVGGPSPDIEISVEGSADYFRHHSSRISGEGSAWVCASGVEGARKITVNLVPSPDTDAGAEGPVDNTDDAEHGGRETQPAGSSTYPYTVRLYFAEPEDSIKTGERVVDVALQGQVVIRGFDVAAQTDGVKRSVVKEFRGIPVSKDLAVKLDPAGRRGAVLCGLEIVAESR
jgi:outer membrane protein assembly factor BamB